MIVEQRYLEPRFLALRYLAAPVGGEGNEQPPQQVRAALRHRVVDAHGAGQRGQTTRLRRLQAQQSDDVAGVGVEILPFGRLVDANPRVIGPQPEVADMPEYMTLSVLRPGIAEVTADAPVGGGTFGDRPPLDRKAPDQHEAASLQHLLAQLVQHRPERWKREIGSAERGDIVVAHRGNGGFDL